MSNQRPSPKSATPHKASDRTQPPSAEWASDFHDTVARVIERLCVAYTRSLKGTQYIMNLSSSLAEKLEDEKITIDALAKELHEAEVRVAKRRDQDINDTITQTLVELDAVTPATPSEDFLRDEVRTFVRQIGTHLLSRLVGDLVRSERSMIAHLLLEELLEIHGSKKAHELFKTYFSDWGVDFSSAARGNNYVADTATLQHRDHVWVDQPRRSPPAKRDRPAADKPSLLERTLTRRFVLNANLLR